MVPPLPACPFLPCHFSHVWALHVADSTGWATSPRPAHERLIAIFPVFPHESDVTPTQGLPNRHGVGLRSVVGVLKAP
jgi:hypothetical protein